MSDEKKLKEYHTVEEYFAVEESEQVKYEYHNGELRAMSGGTVNHGILAGNMITALNNLISQTGKTCLVTSSDVKVHFEKHNSYVYPDAMLICGEVETSDAEKDAVVNPMLVVEVLSKTSGDYDQGEKFRKYCSLDSFKEYVLINQNKPIVEVRYREDPSYWKLVTTIGFDKSVYLTTLDAEIPMSAIYRNVNGLEEPFV